MTNETRQKSFDCVRFIRKARTRINAATASMTDKERADWYKSKEYIDPWLAKMVEQLRDQGSGPVLGDME